MSENQISAPTTAQYRTVPWRPYNVTFDEDKIGPDSFEVRWAGPREITEFDRYQVRQIMTNFVLFSYSYLILLESMEKVYNVLCCDESCMNVDINETDREIVS